MIVEFSVTDFINKIIQVLKRDINRLIVSTRDAGLIKPVELWDEGYLLYRLFAYAYKRLLYCVYSST